MSYNIITGDNITVLKTYPDNHFDSIITDPPYGIEFLAKEWDTNTGATETWEECLRVLKPGGYLLAFSAARTYHHLASNIEGVGFEIRDQIMWLYASGFPKAHDIGKAIQKRHGVKETKPQIGTNAFGKQDGRDVVGGDQFGGMTATYEQDKKDDVIPTSPEAKQWSGWKTALKPAHEPIVMARKPFKGSCIDNVLEHGVGALNIDESKIPWENEAEFEADQKWREKWSEHNVGGPTFQGTDINEQRENSSGIIRQQMLSIVDKSDDWTPDTRGRYPSNVIGEVEEGYQKYFYCPKVSRKERHCGFEESVPPNKDYMVEAMGGTWVGENMIHLPHIGKIYVHGLRDEYDKWLEKHPLAHIATGNNIGDNLKAGSGDCLMPKGKDPLAHIPTAPGSGSNQMYGEGQGATHIRQGATHIRPAVGNNHPTVKPVALMKYLITLVTPPNSEVLDPFCGSGSTGMAAVELGHNFTGIDLDKNYCEIAEKRIEGWNKESEQEVIFNALFDE